MVRTVRKAEDYHVLCIHDFRGHNGEGKPDAIAYAQWVINIELNAANDNPLIFVNEDGSVDVVSADGLELGSGAMGPHPLDHAWRITDTWVGLGFGLERLLMTVRGGNSIGKMGRSLAYLDGITLNI